MLNYQFFDEWVALLKLLFRLLHSSLQYSINVAKKLGKTSINK